MAKKRRREEEAVFQPPEFDEVHYMRREVEAAKGSIITLLLAVAVAVVSFLLTQAGLAALGILLIVLLPFTLKPIYSALGLNLELFDRRVWAAMIFILIAASISIWIVFLNPPFVDHTPPTIKDVQVWVGGNKQTISSTGSVTIQNHTPATLIAYIPDNDPVTATFALEFSNGSVQRVTQQCSTSTAECTIQVSPLIGANTVTVKISAVDSNGNATAQDSVVTLIFA